MKNTRLIAILASLTALAALATDASAYYHPTTGRFISRDPGPGRNSSPPTATAHFPPRDPTGTKPALARRDPLLGSDSARSSGMALYNYGAKSPTLTPPRVGQAGLNNQYADGMNLYAYVGSNPVSKRDPSGLYAGITVHRAPVEKGDDRKNVGHEWIEIKGGASYGFFPTGNLWGSDGVVKSPDPHLGKRYGGYRQGGEDWEVVKMIKIRGILWGMNYYYMYDPYMANGLFGKYSRSRRTGCCKDKNEKDVKACIKKWADFADKHYDYSLPNFTCRTFVELVLKNCCLAKANDYPSAAVVKR